MYIFLRPRFEKKISTCGVLTPCHFYAVSPPYSDGFCENLGPKKMLKVLRWFGYLSRISYRNVSDRRKVGTGLDVNPPKCRNLEVMKSRNANIRHTQNPKCHSFELTILRMAIIRMTFYPNFFDPTCQTPVVSFARKGQFHEMLYRHRANYFR